MRYKSIVFLGKERIKLILFSHLLANKVKSADIDINLHLRLQSSNANSKKELKYLKARCDLSVNILHKIGD